MNRYGPLGLYAALLILTALIFCDAGYKPQVQTFERLEGSLYRADIPALSKANVPLPRAETYLAHLPVYAPNAELLGLPASAVAFIADLSKDPQTPLKITSAQGKAVLPSAAVPKRAAKAASAQKPALVASSAPAAAAVPTRPSVPRDTYTSLAEKLTQNPMTFPLDKRIKKGGMSITLEEVGKFSDYYLLRFSVANNEADEFFIYRIVMTVNTQPISSNQYMPLSCRPAETINGIVRFPVKDVAGRRVGFALVESGGKGRRYEIQTIDYSF